MDPKIVAVIIGVIGALLGVYLKEYIQAKSEKRRSILILRANLHLFLDKIQNNSQLEKILIAGSVLDERYISSLKSGDDRLYREFLSKIEGIESLAENDEALEDSVIDELCSKIRSFSDKEMEFTYAEIDRIREDVEHGTYILGSADVNKLDTSMVHRVLQVKRSINDIFMAIKIGLAGIHEREDVDRKIVRTLIFSAIKEAVLACRHVLPLIKMCNEKL